MSIAEVMGSNPVEDLFHFCDLQCVTRKHKPVIVFFSSERIKLKLKQIQHVAAILSKVCNSILEVFHLWSDSRVSVTQLLLYTLICPFFVLLMIFVAT